MPGLPALPTAPLDAPLRVVVLTCSELGRESAAALSRVAGVEVVAVLQAPLPRPRTIVRRLKLFHRRHGTLAVLALPLRKLRQLFAGGATDGGDTAATGSAIPVVHIDGFHSEAGLAAIRATGAQLAVVDGTNVLKESAFGQPTFGSVNLHCGKLPDYRGAPPGFWELYNGEREVGVTVHRVTAELDGGPILAQSVVPLAVPPRADPMPFLHAFWKRELRPLGLSLLCEAVGSIAAGRAQERAQPPSAHETYRFPDHRTVRELRRRLRAGRR